ncbi:hypothetical protein IMCC3317_13960 [Kordia antarctica]|uniref:Uncharacterized protein n=1 Tax=Kordia antarctica TaxID=1218801 RepID=A0A7L4ZH44_9FLAO|nr:hypothetical protein [Kordia antarctica]QHI36043.1 hypothetical protein IMCC3317_13960 [Kordia antarctica]
MYNQLLGSSLLGNSYGISSGSFSFVNLVLANATSHTRTRWQTFMSDKLKSIKSWINKNGYPLEMKVAKTLKEHGFDIAQSILYKDSETGKYRETDIIAHVTKGINNVWFNLTFIFECKKTIGKPWVVFTNHSDNKSQNIQPPLFASKNAQILVQTILKNNDYRSPILFPDLKKYGYNIVTSHSENKNLAYSATQSVTKATEYLVKKSNESNKKFCNIYVPIVVIEGDLIEASLNYDNDIELLEVDYSTVVSTKSFEEQNSSLLTVVTSDYFGKFAMELMGDCEQFFKNYSKEIELISKNHPTNIPTNIYDNDF